jgi:hypothetical protein
MNLELHKSTKASIVLSFHASSLHFQLGLESMEYLSRVSKGLPLIKHSKCECVMPAGYEQLKHGLVTLVIEKLRSLLL